MQYSTTLTRRFLPAGMTAIAAAALFSGGIAAQDATPGATPEGPSQGYPVAIHSGTCDDLSPDPAYEIGDAVTFGTTGGNEPETIGSDEGVTTVVLGVSADVDDSLDVLGSEGHAIVVHAGPDDASVVACGNIAGSVVDGQLALAIAPAGGGNVVGVAILEDTGGQTNTKVYLFDAELDH